MLTFIFVLTVWTADGQAREFVQDSDMSGADCTTAAIEYVLTNPDMPHGEPSCQIDRAALPAEFVHEGQTFILPPCEFEDSRNCYWDAGERGNGRGLSFYDLGGTAYPFHP